MCPECNSNSVVIKFYDYGTCPDTGYQDAGECFQCRDCGATGDVSELACVGDAYLRLCPCFSGRVAGLSPAIRGT